MKKHFEKSFIKYILLLILLFVLLFVFIIFVFSFSINKEINETSENQITSIKRAIEQHENVNQGHDYFIVKKHKVISNHTPFSIKELQNKFIEKKNDIDKSNKGIFDVRKKVISNQRTLYSLANVKDFYETKQVLVNVLTIGFVFEFILMIMLAYYLARQPVKVYEQLMNEQQLFVQNASHEIKTPIAFFLLSTQYLEMIEGHNISMESNQTLQQMKTEAQYMQQLIESMLIDTNVKNEVVPINVSKSFDEVIRTAEHVYQSTIERRYKSHLIFTIHSLHAKQIINILVENAYRHNTNNTKVSVSAFKNFNGLQIEVSDNGIGIPEEEQQHIFKRFYQVNQNQKGSGIGLALLYNIVKQYHGTIEVKSIVGQGTTFIIKV
ncbi:signal transduction histidine kinase ArlS [Staphylococcus aureus]|uniref:sensor histidine kinase n=1 Tax=Staphylococcus aureus TaxID=1280 RepID=UPI00091C7D4C|nr:HAMP domain-containing sensor histidine kinase [Staphylococcus aureus]SGU53931.1 signal transduction histidine kinase ArlS [Staphylococcus aureus]SHB60959.1 signal transduction histidine kinase ArlS [Staphylococcus aureus]HCX2970798.1 HAMP domain-containing histidine kinase [Staphylococcus aureus]